MVTQMKVPGTVIWVKSNLTLILVFVSWCKARVSLQTVAEGPESNTYQLGKAVWSPEGTQVTDPDGS